MTGWSSALVELMMDCRYINAYCMFERKNWICCLCGAKNELDSRYSTSQNRFLLLLLLLLFIFLSILLHPLPLQSLCSCSPRSGSFPSVLTSKRASFQGDAGGAAARDRGLVGGVRGDRGRV
eukprot:1886691-Rhodomonas_salina.2